MLSDKFYEKEYSENSGVSEKIAKLEELSISMTNLIDSEILKKSIIWKK